MFKFDLFLNQISLQKKGIVKYEFRNDFFAV